MTAQEQVYMNAMGQYYLSTTGPISSEDILMNVPSENLKNLLRPLTLPVNHQTAKDVVQTYANSQPLHEKAAAQIAQQSIHPLAQINNAVKKQ